MGLLARLLASISASLREANWPYGATLIDFQCDGCMAHIWKERQRGIVIDRITRDITNASDVPYLVVRRDDGTTFECYEPYCMRGEAYMQAHTDNPYRDRKRAM